jgi:L-lactate dehydrogenase
MSPGWSSPRNSTRVTVALPRLVGGPGVMETFPLPLGEAEQAQLRASAGVIRSSLDELDRPEA